MRPARVARVVLLILCKERKLLVYDTTKLTCMFRSGGHEKLANPRTPSSFFFSKKAVMMIGACCCPLLS
jgi:hypothetical protein